MAEVTCISASCSETFDPRASGYECPACNQMYPEEAVRQQVPADGKDSSADGSPAARPTGHTSDSGSTLSLDDGEGDGRVEREDSAAPQGQTVTLELGTEQYMIVDNGELQINGAFGADARSAAMNMGVERQEALRIHRDYLEFDARGDTVEVRNVGGDPDRGTNPTRYNDEPFPRGETRNLDNGDSIELGGVITAEVRVES